MEETKKLEEYLVREYLSIQEQKNNAVAGLESSKRAIARGEGMERFIINQAQAFGIDLQAAITAFQTKNNPPAASTSALEPVEKDSRA